MTMMNQAIYKSPTKGRMKIKKVAREISNYIEGDREARYKLIVGTDSAGTRRADFVTAIIVQRIGRGGRYFWKKTNDEKIYHTLRDRIYQEVNLSLIVAQDILAQLQKIKNPGPRPNYDFQIHLDVGQHGPTRAIVKEVVGMVRGNGFHAKIKPESYAASSVADKYT